jgi:hypothetical protein
VKDGRAGPAGNRPADQLHGLGVVALLMAQYAQQVERVGVRFFLG